MDPPPPPPPGAPVLSTTGAVAATTPGPPPPSTHISYPDSVDSSPRSRNTDTWDEQLYAGGGGGGGMNGSGPGKLRLMCSYGGHIVPRPHDKSLCYVGGDTRIVVVDRHTYLSDLSSRLSKTLLNSRSFTLKYQLPNEDLDSLISVTTDEDLENMIDEYDRLNSSATTKSSRLRLFLFPSKPESASSIGSLLENSAKSEDWFLNALNGATRGFSESSSVNCLLGLDDDIVVPNNSNPAEKDGEGPIESFGNVKGGAIGGGGSNKPSPHDVQSVPDSPMLETASSFGSTSSSPSLANLPPIRVRVEDQKLGIEEQFSQMSVQQKQEDGNFVALTSPPAILTTTFPAAAVVSSLPLSSGMVVGDYSNRIFSDQEKSEQGIPVGYRRLPQPQAPPQQQTQQPHSQSQPQQSIPPQFQQKPAGGLDLPSPDSVSSNDGNATNSLSRKSVIYQDQTVQFPSGTSRVSANSADPKITDPNSRVQMQQVQEPSYVLQTQFDPHNSQLHQPQFLHPSTQYIQHHPAGAVPLASYYPVYPPQQQHHHHHPALDQQYPVYYVPARQLGQAQAYNLPVQQPNYSDPSTAIPSSHQQTSPAPSMVPTPTAYNPTRNAPASKPELSGGVYRTGAAPAPSLVQVPSGQHQPQYVGYTTQMHHPSQSIAPNSATANYGYEYADSSHAQIFYSQPMPPHQLAAQYQTMTSAPAVMLPEGSSQLTLENMKQQIKNSQS